MTSLSRLFLALLIAFSSPLFASDLAKEKRWASQVVDAIMDGDAVWLNDGSSDFLGIYTEADEDNKRAAIVMHGTGIHPNWQQVIQPLRVGLVEHGWHTLAIQMPILPNDTEYPAYAPLYDEVAPRIDAAKQYLKDNGVEKIVLVGHSQGASMGAYALSQSQSGVAGFVAIGIGSFADDPRMNNAKALEKITLPILDLYGEDDLDVVVGGIEERAAAAKKAGNSHFSQVEIEGSNHFFDGREDELIASVAKWLDRLAGNK